MRFATKGKSRGEICDRNLSKAYRITGKIIRNSSSLDAMPFYHSLLLYRGLMQLEKSAKSDEDFLTGRQLLYPADLCSNDLDKVMRLKKDAALEYYNCLRDDQMENVMRTQTWAVKWRFAPLSRFLGKLMDAYADIRATRRGEETLLPPVSAVKGEQKKKL